MRDEARAPLNRLRILYTAGIRGELDVLPRLYTFITGLRRDTAGRVPDTRELLLDLGDSCAPAVWHCAVTQGRSALIVLDAMGYHAARADITPEARDRLRANLLSLAVVDEAHPWHNGEVVVLPSPQGEGLNTASLQIMLVPAPATRLEGRTLRLQGVGGRQVGEVELDLSEPPILRHHTIHDLPDATLPDPTITATVDFVLDEARQLQRKAGGNINSRHKGQNHGRI